MSGCNGDVAKIDLGKSGVGYDPAVSHLIQKVVLARVPFRLEIGLHLFICRPPPPQYYVRVDLLLFLVFDLSRFRLKEDG